MPHRQFPARRVAVAVALVLVALVAAGCGSGDVDKKNAYVDQVNQVQGRFAAAFEKLASQITTTSTPAQDSATLQSVQKALAVTVSGLREVKPPDAVKDLHTQLAGEIADYGIAITAAEKALSDSDLQSRTKATSDLSTATTRTSADINRTIGEINQKLRE